MTQSVTTAWQRLTELATHPYSLTDLFAEDSVVASNTNHAANAWNRVEEFQASACGIHLDFSKQLIDQQVWHTLLELAEEKNLTDKIAAMLSGEAVNVSEKRPALHTALRLPTDATLELEGVNIVKDVHDTLDKMEGMVEQIRGKLWRGFAGDAITDVVNLGVGGSDLGPLMASTALSGLATTDIQVHFVSNMDGGQLELLLKHLNPKTTLFIIASKSFSTLDTLSNAQTALAWLETFTSRQTALRRHFIGLSANSQKMMDWGVPTTNQLTLWYWVGGRFSLWSAIGFAVAIQIGMKHFKALLAGANAMDEHFAITAFHKNLPVILGLIGVWNSTFLGINAHTVLPYDGRLKYLPSYLTQLEMESNGKSVDTQGRPIDYATCPILWGEVGSNAQHAFYQLLHQGTQQVSCDFIASIHRYEIASKGLKEQHLLSLANCIAQSRVLAFGNLPQEQANISKSAKAIDHSRQYRGNQPSSTLLLNELTPQTLGALVALYEHKVYVMASIWDINPFDQWGVEMGKKVALDVYDALLDEFSHSSNLPRLQSMAIQINKTDFDASTLALLTQISQR